VHAYVLRQNLFGHEGCGGPGRRCWPLYAALCSLNMALAVTTISLGGYIILVNLMLCVWYQGS
jgi:hypothetical protein